MKAPNDRKLDQMTLALAALICCPLFGAEFVEQILSDEGQQAVGLSAGDVDGDGDEDIVYVEGATGTLSWLENLGGPDFFFESHVISKSAPGGHPVETRTIVIDMDGDGDSDIVVNDDDALMVFYNNGSPTPEFAGVFLIYSVSELSSISVADLDGDGDPDVAAIVRGMFAGSDVTWFENLGGVNPAFATHSLPFLADVVGAGDVDADGDADLLISMPFVNTPAWLENVNGDASGFVAHSIPTVTGGAVYIHVNDVDGDGFADFDVVAGSYLWTFRNLGGLVPAFDTARNGINVHDVTGFCRSDMDGDGDVDIVSSHDGFFGARMGLWENDGGTLAGYDLRILQACDGFDDILSSVIADVDGDGRDDIVTSSECSPAIVWHQNTSMFPQPEGSCFVRDIRLDDLSNPVGSFVDGRHVGEGLGKTLAVVGDVNGDGVSDLLLGTGESRGCSTSPVSLLGVFAGKAYLLLGGSHLKETGLPDLAVMTPDEGCVFNPRGEFQPSMDLYVSAAGDVNNDGLADFLISETQATTDEFGNTGRVYVVFGHKGICDGELGSEIDLSGLDGGNGFVIEGFENNLMLGEEMAGVGDVNMDGIDDFVIGSRQHRAFLIFGRTNWPAEFDLNSLDSGEEGETSGVSFIVDSASASTISSVGSVGDLNDDGIDDLAIGDTRAGVGGTLFVISGRANWPASMVLNDQTFVDGTILINGGGSPIGSTGFGRSIDGAGDVNGDGIHDLIVSTPVSPTSGMLAGLGEVHIVFGQADLPGFIDAGVLDGSDGFSALGLTPFFEIGSTVSGAGDVNGDGYGDVVFSQAATGIFITGSTTVYRGNDSHVLFGGPNVGAGGMVDLNLLYGHNGFNAHGFGEDNAGETLDSGDIDGDGISDVVFGAPRTGAGSCTVSGRGRVYVVFGCEESPAMPGDYDADGDVDLLDFGRFQLCFTGTCAGPPCEPTLYVDHNCAVMDFDDDGDVDLPDFGQFQIAFTGS
jgi:hypothetical protein